MIDRHQLLADLQRLLGSLQDDLRQRCTERPEVEAPLQQQYTAAKDARRTAEAYETWRESMFTQSAVAWILGCVFVRFLEDNGLLDHVYLSGPGGRLAQARDYRTNYFRQNPRLSDREYLEHVFREVRQLPGMGDLFDERHNPLWSLGLSGDGALVLLEFWHKLDAGTGNLAHDFTDPRFVGERESGGTGDRGNGRQRDEVTAPPSPAPPVSPSSPDPTRFLGDLYQDLSDEAKKRYALLQTPEFIEEFILDRTLTPAIETFGYQKVRMIDPTCGSAHFLLGGFHRLFALHQRNHPAVEVRALAQRALDQVFGVDLNPNVVAIARFRLLLAALRVSHVDRLRNAPAFRINVGTGDTLLHGPGQTYLPGTMGDVQHHFESEDAELVRHILGQRYHAVVGNPPYITVKDKALNKLYRERFGSCHGKYSLAAPFMEVFFALTMKAEQAPPTQAGYVGMITSNSFMKREFGKKLVEEFISQWDLTHVIDTAGAYIPGHGTPTVILFGRNQPPLAPTIRTVMGIKGEPSTPDDPALGLVWSAILAQLDQAGSESDFVSVTDMARESFHQHPWSIGGGGAAELKERLDEAGQKTPDKLTTSIGITCFTLEDDIYIQPAGVLERQRLSPANTREMVEGDNVRDWQMGRNDFVVWPYDSVFRLLPLDAEHPVYRFLWPARCGLSNNKMFGGKTKLECGLKWYEFGRLTSHKLETPLSITFAFTATHNHFVLDRGGKVFKQSAMVAKLPAAAAVKDHCELLGVLNSSVGCFWMKQVYLPRGGDHVGDAGARVRKTLWDERYDFDGSKLLAFPIPVAKPLALAEELDRLGQELKAYAPATVLSAPAQHTRVALDAARQRWTETLQRMTALQEDLDWECYRHYDVAEEKLVLTPEHVPSIKVGERAFEVVMARKMAAGELETTWFERHRSTPITELPSHWPEPYRQLVEKRIKLIESDRNIRLIEQPEYKRRWNTEPWEEQLERALREWLLNRLEEALSGVSLVSNSDKETRGQGDGAKADSPRPPVSRSPLPPALTTCAHLADKVRSDAEFMTVANLYRARPDYDLTELVVELVESEAVPFLPVLRYKASGLRKRAAWEETWARQREEDAIDARTQLPEGDPNRLSTIEAKTLKQQQIGDIPVPPKYETKDFLETTFWRLRGKLDVPKERFISYPFCGRDIDRTPVIGWAGWNHLQQAEALANYYQRMRTGEGWSDERLMPVLAGVLELLPWLLQWHNDLDPNFGMGLGDFYRTFANEEMRRMGKTAEDIRAWAPPEVASKARKKKGGSERRGERVNRGLGGAAM